MKYIISILLCFIAFSLYSQEEYQKADKLFSDKDYNSALKLYLDAYNTDSSNIYLNAQIGLCYSNILYKEPEAISYLEKAIETKKNRKNDQIVYALGIAYMHNLQFEKAVEMFELLKKNTDNSEKSDLADLKIANCINAQAYVNSPKDILFINQGKKINTKSSEVNPYITKDEKLLIFSSDIDVNYDIYINLRKKFLNSWTVSQQISKDINTSENQIVSGTDAYADNIFYYIDNDSCDINIIEFKDFTFQSTSNLSDNINSEYCEKGITTVGLDTLIFSSNIPGGYGGFDLYYSIKLPNGYWGKPINLGEKINTEYNENFPSYFEETNTLYFSSDKPESIGGYDIFYSKLNTDSLFWTNPQNIGYPLNTTYDNNSISFLEMGRYAYVSRYNVDSYGKEDIYKAVFKDEEPQFMVFKVYIDVYSPETKAVKPISDYDSNIEISVMDLDNISVYGKYIYDKQKNYFIISLPPGLYSLQITGNEYNDYEKNIFVEERLMQETLDDLKIELELKQN